MAIMMYIRIYININWDIIIKQERIELGIGYRGEDRIGNKKGGDTSLFSVPSQI